MNVGPYARQIVPFHTQGPLAGERGNEVCDKLNFGFPTARLDQRERKPFGWQSGFGGSLSPNADHWSVQSIGRSIRRLIPKPRGRPPSIAALTSAGQRKASEMVRRIQRSLLLSRVAGHLMVWVGTGGQFVEPVMSVPKRVSEDRAHSSALIERVAQGRSPSPWMILRRRWGDGGVQGMIRIRFSSPLAIPSVSSKRATPTSGGDRREVRPASGARREGLRSGSPLRERASAGHRSSHHLRPE